MSFVEPVEQSVGNFESEAEERHLASANVVEPADMDTATVLQSLVMIDKFDGNFADVALVMDGATPEKQWTEEEIAAVSFEHGFKVPGSFKTCAIETRYRYVHQPLKRGGQPKHI